MNEEPEQNDDKSFELITLNPEQHAVTPVPKFTTELPFFYLTKQKQLLQQDIHFEGKDGYGNPIRWDVIPNRSPKIGVPAIEAHAIFTQLVKPMMEMLRRPDGSIPEILPLGGIRQCLRTVGWKEGGWEARGLLQGLMQIGQATCDFDFMLPTGVLDAEGKLLFKTIKGIFSRFSIWKIGSKHVSEEELATGSFKFDFDLDDTLYIQLHKVERDIQRSQDQRYLDNQYMFSVEARARRWYELLAAKIFGVVKNGGTHCEISYSWYVKHHHTLMRCLTRARAVKQMNRIVGDHIASGFISRVEYRTTKDEDGRLDVLIRYYPGPEARESVRRVLSFLNISTFPGLLARRKNRKGAKPAVEIADLAEPSGAPKPGVQAPAVDQELLDALVKRDVMRGTAMSLLVGKSKEQIERAGDYIDYWDSIRNEKRPGLLVSLIQSNNPLPSSFQTKRQRSQQRAAEDRRKKLERVNETVERRYGEHCRHSIDRHIAEALPAGEYESQVNTRREETLQVPGFWGERPEFAEQLARNEVRAEIARTVPLPTLEEFRRQELPRILSELNLDPGVLGLELEHLPDNGEPVTAQDALNCPPPGDNLKEEVFSIPEQNSSPAPL